jgi:hypothetical protein
MNIYNILEKWKPFKSVATEVRCMQWLRSTDKVNTFQRIKRKYHEGIIQKMKRGGFCGRTFCFRGDKQNLQFRLTRRSFASLRKIIYIFQNILLPLSCISVTFNHVPNIDSTSTSNDFLFKSKIQFECWLKVV